MNNQLSPSRSPLKDTASILPEDRPSEREQPIYFTSPNSPDNHSFKTHQVISASTPDVQISKKRSNQLVLYYERGMKQKKNEIDVLKYQLSVRDSIISDQEKTIKILEDDENIQLINQLIDDDKKVYTIQEKIQIAKEKLNSYNQNIQELKSLKKDLQISKEDNDQMKQMLLQKNKKVLYLQNEEESFIKRIRKRK